MLMLQHRRHHRRHSMVLSVVAEQLRMLLDVSHTQATVGKIFLRHHPTVKWHTRFDAGDLELVENSLHTPDGPRTVLGMYDQLAEKRIIVEGNLETRRDPPRIAR